MWWDQKKQTNRDLVYQFYLSTPEEAFLHSRRPVFALVNLAAMQAKHACAPLRTIDGPDTDKHYGIGVDAAEGLEHGDNAVIDVQCLETGEQVAEAAGKFAPHELARLLGVVGRIYSNHLAVIERNNHGHTVIAYAKEDPALTLYQREEKDKITDKLSLVIG